MIDILQILPGKKRTTSSGWVSFNAVCCQYFGHKPDRRYRGGLKLNGSDWAYNCFNCGYKCSYRLGDILSKRTRKLLGWCGLDEEEIQRLSVNSMRYRDVLNTAALAQRPAQIVFNSRELPPGELLDQTNPRHAVYVQYLRGRGLDPAAYPYLVTPDDPGRNSNRIIVPYTYKDRIVGHTSRYLDDRSPKYINDGQTGYVFGYDFQLPQYEVCIVVEGIFDALSIGGCALMHNTVGGEQAELLRTLNRQIIMVPDRDRTGLAICERALELGWSVSIPDWHRSIKDVNDAVNKYGRLATLLSILQCATTSKIKVELCRRKLVE